MSVIFVNLKIENFKYVVCGQVAVIKEVYTLFEYIYISSFWTILPYDLSAIVCHFKTVLSCRIYFWIDKNKVSFSHCSYIAYRGYYAEYVECYVCCEQVSVRNKSKFIVLYTLVR